jgi:predicted nucleic acid-binding Zn ribbon protein
MGRSMTTRLRGRKKRRKRMNIFYIIGVVVVVLAVFGYLRLG